MSSPIASQKSKQIHGSRLPSFIQLYQWITNPLGYLESCAKKYGDTFKVNLMGFPPFIIVTDPQTHQEIFRVDAKKFDTGRSNSSAKVVLGDNSLVLMDGARHRRERILLMPSFHGDRVKVHAETICLIATKTASQWQTNQVFLAQKTMQNITFEVILQVVFGLSEGERYQQIKPLLSNLLEILGSPMRSSFLFVPILQQDWGAWSPWGRFIRCRTKFYELLQTEINQRRADLDGTGNDVLSLMLSARDEDGQAMSDAELKDELMTLLVAGHETTATALSWSFYWVEKTPRVKAKLLAELNTLPPNSDPLDVAKLPYLSAVCSETLRIYPVAIITFSRIAKSSIQIKDLNLHAEEMVASAIYLTHHREDIYPDPNKFIPERFIDKKYAPTEFVPFGGGARGCIGYTLALLEIKLVLATILSNYDLALNSNRPSVPKRRGSTVAPDNGVPLKFLGKRKR